MIYSRLPLDVYRQIFWFVFWDKRKPDFALHLRRTITGRNDFLTMIETSEIDYTPSDYDVFWEIMFPSEHLNFVCSFCKTCGNYTYSYNMNQDCMNPRTECVCDFN